MWKVVTGIAVVALAVFLFLRHDPDETGEQSAQKSGTSALSGMPADTQVSSSTASRPASQRAEAGDTVQPQFTSYENKPPRRVTKSTTGTVVVFPDGRRIPPR